MAEAGYSWSPSGASQSPQGWRSRAGGWPGESWPAGPSSRPSSSPSAGTQWATAVLQGRAKVTLSSGDPAGFGDFLGTGSMPGTMGIQEEDTTLVVKELTYCEN